MRIMIRVGLEQENENVRQETKARRYSREENEGIGVRTCSGGFLKTDHKSGDELYTWRWSRN
jgi:hypothetical protein